MSLVSLLAHLESVSHQPCLWLSIVILTINEPASYLPLIAYLRQVLANAHKKAYTISVGKLNPAKLANFAEIECFVLVACPENSLLDAKVQSTSISPILVLNVTRTSSGPLLHHSNCNLRYSLHQHGLASMCSILTRSLHVEPPSLHQIKMERAIPTVPCSPL